jgi:3',5'-cyclic AMP phosphodiesterase CpdA
MPCIAHISDLHFGYNDPLLVDALRQSLWQIKPDVLAVSGDLVEHATVNEFEQARDFLQSLPKPQIVVPGNHDLPFYNLWLRAIDGLRNFRRYISEDPTPTYVDGQIAVIGFESAHHFPVKGGKITEQQLDSVVQRFSALPDCLIRVLVTHHPFDLPEPATAKSLIGHSRHAVTRLAPVVDVLLAGHIHVSSAGSTSSRYGTGDHAMVFVQAGTAVSNRHKGEVNSFNVLHTGRSAEREKQIQIDRYTWGQEQARFLCSRSEEFRLGKEGWAQVQQRSTSQRTR